MISNLEEINPLPDITDLFPIEYFCIYANFKPNVITANTLDLFIHTFI